MKSHRWPYALLLFGLVSIACSDSPTNLPDPGGPLDPPGLSGLIVSEPGRVSGVSYVSAIPGWLAGAVSVEIRNVTSGADPLPIIRVVSEGFDPVGVPASVGDMIELKIGDETGSTRIANATVPKQRVPALLRVSPGPEASGVAVHAPIRLVFSEPLHPGTLNDALYLSGGDWLSGETRLAPDEPWVVEFVLRAALEPATQYEISMWSILTDLAGNGYLPPDRGGNGFSALWDMTFTTEAPAVFGITDSGRIAFVSTREGGQNIYVVYPDGTGLTRLAPGAAPAWSPDGRRIAFQTPNDFPRDIRIIEADGSNERLLVANGSSPTWSPGGRKVAFSREGEIFVVNADGSGETVLVGRGALGQIGASYDLHTPSWSPDGRSIAFIGGDPGWGSWIYLTVNADGSGLRDLNVAGADGLSKTAWSPDGARLLLSAAGEVTSVSPQGSDPLVHAYGRRPDWSAQGRLVAYQRHRAGMASGLTRIFVANLASGQRRQLVPDDPGAPRSAYSDYDAVWSRTP